jgi:uncharacterized protein YjiS (DUF1127 family)
MFTPLIRRYADWRQRRIAICMLHSLDDWLLADLGTQRDQIERFVADIVIRH